LNSIILQQIIRKVRARPLAYCQLQQPWWSTFRESVWCCGSCFSL